MIDKISKLKWFIIISAIGISVSTALNALAVAFWGILYPRCLLALFSAGIDPASMKLISLNFTSENRGVAYGLYLATVYVGSALASLTLVLSSGVGWRLTFLITGIIGAFFAVLGIFTIKNTAYAKESLVITEEHTQKSDWGQLVKNRTLVFTLIATFFRYSAGFSRGYYEALYFSAEFSNYKTEYSVLNAIALLIAPISLTIVGKFTDIQEGKGKAKYRAILCSFTNLIAVPLLIAMYTTSSFPLAMTCLIIVYSIGEAYISISIVMMMNVTAPHLRGLRNTYLETALLFCVSFLGGTISTVSLGLLNTSHSNLRLGLIGFVVLGYFFAGLFFIITIFSYPKDLKSYEEEAKITNL